MPEIEKNKDKIVALAELLLDAVYNPNFNPDDYLDKHFPDQKEGVDQIIRMCLEDIEVYVREIQDLVSPEAKALYVKIAKKARALGERYIETSRLSYLALAGLQNALSELRLRF